MGRFRDAITGLFTTKAHAEVSPDTTVRETVKRPSEWDRRVTPGSFSNQELIDEVFRRKLVHKLLPPTEEG